MNPSETISTIENVTMKQSFPLESILFEFLIVSSLRLVRNLQSWLLPPVWNKWWVGCNDSISSCFYFSLQFYRPVFLWIIRFPPGTWDFFGINSWLSFQTSSLKLRKRISHYWYLVLNAIWEFWTSGKKDMSARNSLKMLYWCILGRSFVKYFQSFLKQRLLRLFRRFGPKVSDWPSLWAKTFN